MKNILLFISLFCLSPQIFAASWLDNLGADTAAGAPMQVEDAFQLSGAYVGNTLKLHWDIAKGVYLYADKFQFQAPSKTDGQVAKPNELGAPQFPVGETKQDEILGIYTVYRHTLDIAIPVLTEEPTISVDVTYQGCSDQGFCYPPVQQTLALHRIKDSAIAMSTTVAAAPSAPASTTAAPSSSLLDLGQNVLFSPERPWLFTFFAFYGFGLLLAFTPCVLPLIPILSSIIVGQKSRGTRRLLGLTSSYVLGMAFTYAVAGAIGGLVGSGWQAYFQTPLILSIFILILIGLALSLFGLYEIKLPHALTQRLHHLHQKSTGGTYVGTATMGVLSALIASPCITPPLMGALLYISQTGNAFLGGTALFILGLGLGTPLIIAGTFGAHWLPKSGAWMIWVKEIFGVLLLALSIILLSRFLTGPIILLLWAILCIFCAVYIGVLNIKLRTHFAIFTLGLACLLFIQGTLLMIGAAIGHSDPLRPLVGNHGLAAETPVNKQFFQRIKTREDLDSALASAISQKKITMLDFYADWCVSCIILERKTFPDPRVQSLLQSMQLLQADVTKNDDADKALQKSLGVFAPPTILFFSADGSELQGARIVGEINAEDFSKHLQKVLLK